MGIPRQPKPDQRILVLAPHPDDESLGCGGLLARAAAVGADVRVVFATDGDNAPWIQRAHERRWRIAAADRERFGQQRRREALAALERLGIESSRATFLGCPDQGVSDQLLRGGGRTFEELSRLVLDFRPELVVGPADHDAHPDHNALAVMVRMAVDAGGHACEEWQYEIHAREREPWAGASAWVLELSEREQRAKREAIQCHESQLTVHRKKFLGYARARETYWPRGVPLARPPLTVEGSTSRVRLTLRLRSGLGSFGAARIALLGWNPWEGVRVLELAVPSREGEVELRERGTGRIAGRASVRRAGARREIIASTAALGTCTRLFAKCERAHGFFDAAGWFELQAARDEALVPAPASSRARRQRANVAVVVPCFEVAQLCGPVVEECTRYARRVIAVDDGSTDGTGAVLDAVADRHPGRVTVLHQPSNGGKGVALMAGFRAALADPDIDMVITIDGDGQHRAEDLPSLVQAWKDGADFVVGERTQVTAMPLRSRLGNQMTTFLLRTLRPECPRDTQSGYRGFDRALAERVTREIRGSRYETELRILLMTLAERTPIACVPIPTVYLDGNRSSHFRPLQDSARIYAALLGSLPSMLAGRRGRHGY